MSRTPEPERVATGCFLLGVALFVAAGVTQEYTQLWYVLGSLGMMALAFWVAPE